MDAEQFYVRASAVIDEMRDDESRRMVEAKELMKWDQASVHCERQLILIRVQMELNKLLEQHEKEIVSGHRFDRFD